MYGKKILRKTINKKGRQKDSKILTKFLTMNLSLEIVKAKG